MIDTNNFNGFYTLGVKSNIRILSHYIGAKFIRRILHCLLESLGIISNVLSSKLEINGNDALRSRFGNFLKVAKFNLSSPIIDEPTSKKLANHYQFD